MARTPRSSRPSTKATTKNVKLGTGGRGHVDVRKISNGYIVSETREVKRRGGMTDFESKETFVRTKPKIQIT